MFALGLLLVLICSAQEAPTFRSDVSLVRLDAEVTDGIRTLHGFRKEDFVVKDNGQPQQVLYFSQDEVPLDLILLFDISTSMRPNVQRVAVSASTALSELRPGDRVAVMTFHRTSQIVAPFSEDLAAVERTIDEKVVGGKFRGGTHLLAGVDDAAKYFLEEPRNERRRAVLILTDNYGQRSRKGSTVIHHLWEADASLSGLIIHSAGEQAVNTVAMAMNPLLLALREGMEGVADKTGGDTLKASNAGEDFQEMMRRIRQRYSLYYAMPQGKPGEQRMVRVELSSETLSRYPKARARAPKGYVMR
jgi:VWFA-related protein